jgi:hypothetical protein
LPPDFAFGAAPAGVIQRHVGPACGGVPISPDPITGNVHQPTDWLAHLAIEDEYVHAFAPEDDVFYSRFWTDNTRTLRGRLVNRNFATELLNALRFWPIGNRPNIIDFGRRRAYFVRIVPFRADYSGQINRFHDLVRQLGRKHNEQAWNPSEAAIWYPAHNLPLDINDPLDTRFVCTQATEYNLGPGLILYDIRREKDEEEDRRSRQRRVQTFTNLDVDQDYADVWPTMRSEIPTQVQYYDTAYPDYVVIVPREFHSVWTSRKADQRNEYARGFYRPRPSFDFPGGHFVKDLKRQLYYASLVIGGISLAVVVVAASAVGAAYAAGAESIALAEAGTAARGAAVVDELAVARAAKAARSGLAVGGGLTAAREVVKRAAAATLLGFGIAKNARAGTLEPVQSGVITAVPIAQFYMDATTLPSATRDATPIEYYADYSKVPEVVKSTFRLGAYVSFDYKPHVIVAKLTAK